jgi:hypothetical protein
VTGLLVPSVGQKILVQLGWYLPLAEDRFLQAGKGAENTKEKIQAVLHVGLKSHYENPLP